MDNSDHKRRDHKASSSINYSGTICEHKANGHKQPQVRMRPMYCMFRHKLQTADAQMQKAQHTKSLATAFHNTHLSTVWKPLQHQPELSGPYHKNMRSKSNTDHNQNTNRPTSTSTKSTNGQRQHTRGNTQNGISGCLCPQHTGFIISYTPTTFGSGTTIARLNKKGNIKTSFKKRTINRGQTYQTKQEL